MKKTYEYTGNQRGVFLAIVRDLMRDTRGDPVGLRVEGSVEYLAHAFMIDPNADYAVKFSIDTKKLSLSFSAVPTDPASVQLPEPGSRRRRAARTRTED